MKQTRIQVSKKTKGATISEESIVDTIKALYHHQTIAPLVISGPEELSDQTSFLKTLRQFGLVAPAVTWSWVKCQVSCAQHFVSCDGEQGFVDLDWNCEMISQAYRLGKC